MPSKPFDWNAVKADLVADAKRINNDNQDARIICISTPMILLKLLQNEEVKEYIRILDLDAEEIEAILKNERTRAVQLEQVMFGKNGNADHALAPEEPKWAWPRCEQDIAKALDTGQSLTAVDIFKLALSHLKPHTLIFEELKKTGLCSDANGLRR